MVIVINLIFCLLHFIFVYNFLFISKPILLIFIIAT